MPLSEEELRLLEQMERALAEEDPRFVSTIQGTTIERVAKMHALIAGAVFLGGIAMLLGGAIAQETWLGILGFVVMLAAAVIGLTAWSGRGGSSQRQHADLSNLDEFAADPHGEQFQKKFRLVDGGRRDRQRHPSKGKPAKPKPSGTFMQRMEQRWQQRRDRGGY